MDEALHMLSLSPRLSKRCAGLRSSLLFRNLFLIQPMFAAYFINGLAYFGEHRGFAARHVFVRGALEVTGFLFPPFQDAETVRRINGLVFSNTLRMTVRY